MWNTNAISTASYTTPSFSVNSGDTLVAVGVTSDNSVTLTISSSTSVTWTQQQVVSVASYCYVSLWTAPVTSTGSMTVTVTRSSAQVVLYGVNVLTFSASDGVGASAKTNVSSGAPTLNLTTTQANSAIVVVNADWNSSDGASRTWRSNAGSLTEQTYFRDSSQYTVYAGYHADAGSVSTYAVGLSAPGSQKYSIAAVEIKGTTSAASPPPNSQMTRLIPLLQM